MNLKTTLFVFLIFSTLSVSTQSFLEKQLPTPNKLSSFFIGPLIKSTIHYGAKPSNFNGKVLLFNHGYIDLNQLFFTNNTFYKDAYNAGFQVVFVATTRGGGMWINGKLLAESIDIITNKYQINNLSLIAHSNGGKAAEVAMFTHNKKDKVKNVFALGTPFWGTYLADISQQWWLNWLWSKTGLNEGSATSTTYYCRDVVRPYFDNLSTNQPSKFFIFGASGFNRGHTILSPLMFTSGSVLYAAQGTNDGVTPYSSSLRPNANFLFGKGKLKLDHIDVALGQYIWPHLAPLLNTTTVSKATIKSDTNRNIISSNYQIINSENSYDEIILNEKNNSPTIEVFHEKSIEDFTLFANNNELTKVKYNKSNNKPLKHSSNYVLNKKNNHVSLEGNSRFAAFIHFKNGPKMTHEVLNKETLNITFKNTYTPHKNINVNAIITKTADLYGNKIEEESFIYPFIYNVTSKSFNLDISDFKDGVYSTHITGKNTNFTRSIISGFTIGSINSKQLNNEIIKNNSIQIDLKSNQINDKIEFITRSNNDLIKAIIYNLNGQTILQQKLTAKNGSFTIKKDISNLPKGLYIVVIEGNNLKKSFRIIKK